MRISALWDRVRSGYWFLPALLLLAAILLSYATQALDHASDGRPPGVGWISTWGAAGARDILSTAAGSVITVAGVAFSITVVAFVLAASQLGSKVLRTFMRDRGSQAALGTFVGSYAYCLLTLRTIRGENGGETTFVPSLSVAVGILLALLSVAMLVYFIHHVALMIQAEHVIAEIAGDLRRSIERLYPEEIGEDDAREEREPALAGSRGSGDIISAAEGGYIQDVDGDALVRAAEREDVFLRALARPGDFAHEGQALAELWPPTKSSDRLREEVADAFTIGRHRTHWQDVLFGIDQMIQVALRALSPGVNDSPTAFLVMDWLGAELRRYGRRRQPPAARADSKGRPRILLRHVSAEEVANAALDPLRRAVAADAGALRRLLRLALTAGAGCPRADFLQTVLAQVRRIAADVRESRFSESDRGELEERCRETLTRLVDAPRLEHAG